MRIKNILIDDIERVCHPDANLEQGFLVHLYRLSTPGAMFSGRDWSPKSAKLLSKDDIVELVFDKPIEVYYGMFDSTGQHATGVWLIKKGKTIPVIKISEGF
ncbi:hypothetical protein ACFLYP_03765 [Chloroflexota bacterium]